MSLLPNQYRFHTEAQWNTGLARRLAWVGDGLEVTHAWATRAEPVVSDLRAGPLAIARGGAVYWVEYSRTLRWRYRHHEQSGAIEVASEIAAASRLVAGRRWLWTHSAERAELHRFALDTLTGPETFRLRELLSLDSRCDELEVIDIAADGCDGLWLLLSPSRKPVQLLHLSERGKLRSAGDLPYCDGVPTAITALTGEVAVLHGDTQRLLFVRTSDMTAIAEMALATLGRGFQSTCLGGDGVGQVMVGCTVAGHSGRCTQIDVLRRTASGVDLVGTRALPAAGSSGARAVALRQNELAQSELWVSTAHGVLRFGPASQADPDEPQALYLTPVLTSFPSGSVSGWLRADLDVDLPLGTSVTMAYATTSDQQVHDAVVGLAGSSDVAADQRITQIDAALGNALTTTAIKFEGASNGSTRTTVSIPLSIPMGNAPGNNTDIWLWVLISISSGAAGPLPTLRGLQVLYPFGSLMDHLPAIFRGPGQFDGFMLDLVGILETTSQGLDTEIGNLARVLDPRHTPAKWLDVLGGWLGLPWDVELDERQKRAILNGAAPLLARRGTRAALAEFLRCLFPAAHIDIIDQAADLQPARVGDAASTCLGAPLPAILTGWPSGLAVLGEKSILNCSHLACGLPTEVADAPPPSVLRIDIAASLAAQNATPLDTVQGLLAYLVPAECQPRLRWRPFAGGEPKLEADGTLVLDGPGPGRVGESAQLGYVVLDGHDRATLDAAGLSTEERLQ
jgi:phage tail-like protein